MNRYTILIFIFSLLISSCTVYKEYPIDIYKPGEIVVPAKVENVALVYRNFKFPGDSLQHYYKDNGRLRKAKNDHKSLDSLLANYCLKELASNLKSQNTFKRIHIFPGAFKPHSGKKLPSLKFNLIKKLTASSETDLLISLETFSYFFSEYAEQYEVPKSREVITAAVWAIYDPAGEKIIERKTMIDTVYWNSYDEEGKYLKKTKLPPRPSALKIASQLSGENYSKRFFASWQKVNRMYSVPPLPDFSQASAFVDEGKWDSAIEIWKRYAPDKNGKMAINARYNLALAYEMKDDILTAWKWLSAAQELALEYKSKEDIKMILQYKKILATRKRDIDRLNQN
ncbi:MAG: hypothetical protein HQ522_03735 [Bacteroidetes bacterium]|nr:hypothetical protein [Bacteroidota bacterium]